MKNSSDHVKIAATLAKLLDSQFSLFGLRFGIDPLFAIIPGAGTIVPTLLSLYLLWIGNKMNIPSGKKVQMIVNIIIDAFLGSLPLIGIVSDAFFKANIKNLEILQAYDKQNPATTPIERIVT